MLADAFNPLWLPGITYVPTHEGWLYLVSVLDAYSRKVAAWYMDERLGAELVGDAHDNVMAESFVSTLKRELVHWCLWPTRQPA